MHLPATAPAATTRVLVLHLVVLVQRIGVGSISSQQPQLQVASTRTRLINYFHQALAARLSIATVPRDRQIRSHLLYRQLLVGRLCHTGRTTRPSAASNMATQVDWSSVIILVAIGRSRRQVEGLLVADTQGL